MSHLSCAKNTTVLVRHLHAQQHMSCIFAVYLHATYRITTSITWFSALANFAILAQIATIFRYVIDLVELSTMDCLHARAT